MTVLYIVNTQEVTAVVIELENSEAAYALHCGGSKS
jgi:hypothetical protein